MSTVERIAKLEALLARISSRALEPRKTNGEGKSQLQASDASDAPVEPEEAPEVQSAQLSGAAIDVDLAEIELGEAEVDEEALLGETQQMDVAPAEEAHSRERIVAASAVPVAPLEGSEPERPAPIETGERATASQSPPTEITESQEGAEVVEAAVSGVADVEEPPASSRRPIALEPKLEELAFGDAPPLQAPHTPPPESGRQVAAATVDLDFEHELTGVRSKEPEHLALDPPDMQELTLKLKAPTLDTSAPEITEATVSRGPAAVFQGNAPVFAPATFGELLDATLGL